MIFYNDNALYPCRVLDRHITEGTLPEGDIYYGDIEKIGRSILSHYHSHHLFAGIGGIPFGLRMGGWQDEWPILTAGFPCQPVSYAGKQLAQGDPRWLWPEVVRVLRVVRSPIVLLENTPGLLNRGMEDVLRDLARCGYDAKWRVFSAYSVGAPHRRERVWVAAYAMEDSDGVRLEKSWEYRAASYKRSTDTTPISSGWDIESDVDRVAHGLPNRVDRVKALGNAVVPQVVAALVPWILEEAKL